MDTSGTITTVAGNGSCCFSGDGGAATDAGLGRPWDVAFDSDGNMFIADAVDRIRKVDTSGVITTAAISSFGTPNGVAVDASGDVFVSENFSNRIGMVDASTQVITRVVGSIPPGFSGDGGLETDALMSVPLGLDLDGLGNLFIAEWGNDRIRRVDAFTGIITTVAGNGTPTGSIDGEGGDPTDDLGDGGPAVDASLFDPFDVVADSSGNLYLADFGNHRIRKVDTSGIITTVAGTGVAGFSGDGGPATEAQLNGPTGLAFDHSGNIYIADWTDYRIRKIEAATGIITTVAGNGSRDFSGDGDRATDASLIPTDLAVDAFGNLFIADYNNGRVRKVDTDGIITTYAGNGDCCLAGDDGLATSAAFSSPVAVVLDPAGDLFISDIWTHRIRKVVAASGIVVAVSGSGPTDFFDGGYSGDGGPATSATHAGPVGIAIDPSGNLLIADQNSHVVRMVEGVAAARCDLEVGLNFADGITTWTFVVGAGEPSTWSTSVILLGNDIPLWSIDLPTLPPITISFSFPIPPIGVIEVRSTLAVDGGGCTTSDSVDTGL